MFFENRKNSTETIESKNKPHYKEHERSWLNYYASKIEKATHWFDMGCGYDSSRLGYVLEHGIHPKLLFDQHYIHSLARDHVKEPFISIEAHTPVDISIFCDHVQRDIDERGHAIINVEQKLNTEDDLLIPPNHSFVLVRTNEGDMVRVESYKMHFGGRVVDWSEWRNDLKTLIHPNTLTQEWKRIFGVEVESIGENAILLELERHDGKVCIHFMDCNKYFHPFLEKESLLECIKKNYPNMMNIGY